MTATGIKIKRMATVFSKEQMDFNTKVIGLRTNHMAKGKKRGLMKLFIKETTYMERNTR